jgi:hypothetical protein
MKRIAQALNAVALAAAVLTGIGSAAQANCGQQVHIIQQPVVVTQTAAVCPPAVNACTDILCGPSEVAIREAELRNRIANALSCGRISAAEASALLCEMDRVAAQMKCFGADGCISYTESRVLYKNWDKIARAYDDSLGAYDYAARIASVRLLNL